METSLGKRDKALNNSAVNNSMDRRLLQTSDGSYTLWIPEVGETYHSRHGAEQESRHVYIQNGLFFSNKKQLSILEVGLGTGLNVLLTIDSMQDRNVEYLALEPFPIERALVEALIATKEKSHRRTLLQQIHDGVFNEFFSLSPQFHFQKAKLGIQELEMVNHFDLIYFDAFGPSFEPDLWTSAVMRRCYDLLKTDGVWVSYCAKGDVRRNLVQAGFQVERLPGPPGKREMLRGIKK